MIDINMNKNETYVDVLITSLRKKIDILEKLDVVIEEQEQILKKPKIEIEQVDENHKKKEKLLDELEKADVGFESVFSRVKEEITENKYQYESEIKEMQGYIKKITDLTVKLQAQERRNKQFMEIFFRNKKNEVRIFHQNNKSAEKYNRNMANRVSGQSYFMDKKK